MRPGWRMPKRAFPPPPKHGALRAANSSATQRTCNCRRAASGDALAAVSVAVDAAGQAMQDHAPGSEPAYLSLRALMCSAPQWDIAKRAVHVCENPNLVAIAADVLGPHRAPLVGTDGMPAATARPPVAIGSSGSPVAVPRRFRLARHKAVTVRWDGALSAAMQTSGRAIDEEALAASLLIDLDIRTGQEHIRQGTVNGVPYK